MITTIAAMVGVGRHRKAGFLLRRLYPPPERLKLWKEREADAILCSWDLCMADGVSFFVSSGWSTAKLASGEEDGHGCEYCWVSSRCDAFEEVCSCCFHLARKLRCSVGLRQTFQLCPQMLNAMMFVTYQDEIGLEL